MQATVLLNQIDLARRWKISHRSLERWRVSGQGPRFTKIGGAVRYRLEDIEAFEQKNLHNQTPLRSRFDSSEDLEQPR